LYILTLATYIFIERLKIEPTEGAKGATWVEVSLGTIPHKDEPFFDSAQLQLVVNVCYF